jgi:hypothetical protein
MRLFTRLLDVIALRSEKPFRRLLAYYLFLGAVIFILYRLLPFAEDVLQNVNLAPPDQASQVLEDGLPGASEVVTTGGGPTAGLPLVFSAVGVMLFTLALMLPVSWVFMSARRASNFDQSIVQTLLILPLVVAGIVMVVQTSLALAFSLGGIVAGLRIRTTIRDVRDMVYLFLGIGVGLAVGVHALIVATVLSVTFNMVVLAAWRYDFGRKVLEPTASAQRSGPLGDLVEQEESAAGVPDRDLVLALSPQRAEALAKRFRRVSRVLGNSKGAPRYNAILTVTTGAVSEAQTRVEQVLDTMSRRWRLDEVATHEGKPSELYYLVRVRKSVTRDQFLTAIRESAGSTIVTADLEIGDALAQEKEKGP